MPKCVVKKCKNYTLKVQKKDGVSYFHFPQNEIRKRKWRCIIARDREDELYKPNASSVICSDHFRENDMYLTKNGLKRIKKTAIPNLNLSESGTKDVKVAPSITGNLESPSTSRSKTSFNTTTNLNIQMDLYYTAGSAPCRVVLLVAAALNVELNLKEVNLRDGQHLTHEFLKLNPQHTVPTLVDGDFSLWESRAISRYLIRKSSDQSLYPEDPKTRALVDQRLDFDLGTLYPRFGGYFYPQVFAGKQADSELLNKLEEALAFLDTFLDGHKYAVGESLTLADLSLVATVSTIDAAGISLEPYPRAERWYKLVQATAPGYEEANEKGIKNFRVLVASLKVKSEL